ncbi:hypothetical protein VKT23_017057 [Stygiomarasmius scandens]|uniref:Uncharacterized protein n=1 Tax=Marasmiellus scandens TaxID=2682957 RepID=A0ABR1IXG1_9AGAR
MAPNTTKQANKPRQRSRKLLFTPPSGGEYKVGDFDIICRSTPIPLYKIPRYLLQHPAIPGFHAPWLWCGWSGTDYLFKLVETKYPDELVRDSWGEVGIYESLFKLSYIVNKEFQIPEDFHRLVQVVDVALPDGQVDLGLVIGSNFEGLLPFDVDYLGRISRDLFDGREPEWMLDAYRWKWVPRDRGRRPELPNPNEPKEYGPPPQFSPSLRRLLKN